jgi:uncharacterized protein with HEPN domain
MRDDRLRLHDIIQAIDLIFDFARGKTEENLATDKMLQSAIFHQFYVIGEAANRISLELKNRHSNVP